MTYLVLARKWRPQLFSEVVGQPHVTKILQNAIKTGRLAHAYLFSGPRGVGKTSVARILSKAINCEKGVTPEPCNQCKNCLDIAAGKSPDVLEIDGASNRGIDNIRNLQESIAYKPIRSRYKIYIIDEVHMLTNEAFNALLKTLEEPPSHVKFIFATTDPHKLPPTVVSRCQRFEFRRIPVGLIVEHLNKICREEDFDISPDIINAIAREAEGGMRDAETLLEQVVSFHGEDIKPEELLDLLGIVDRATIMETIKAVVNSDYLRCSELAQRIYERGIDCVKFFDRLLEIVQNLFLVTLGSSETNRFSNVASDELEEFKNIASKINVETLQLYYEILLRGSEQARRSADPHFVLEATLIKLANVPNLIPIPEILRELQSFSKKRLPQTSGICLNERIKEEKVNRGNFIIERKRKGDVVSDWPLFLEWLNEQDPLLRTQLEGSKPFKVENNKYQIMVVPVYAEILNLPEKIKHLRAMFEDFFNLSNVFLDVKAGSTNSAGQKNGSHKEGDGNIRQMALNHPAVKDAIEILGGHIVEIRRIKRTNNLENNLE